MLVGGTCVSLGFWQLDRATERRTIAATIEQGRKATAIESADLRHDNGYAIRVRGVSTQDVPAKR